MEYLNDKGIILLMPREDRILLVGAITIAINAVNNGEATEADLASIDRLNEIKTTLINAY